MTEEEMIEALLTDYLTGLPNSDAWNQDEEPEGAPTKIVTALDGLSYFNSVMGRGRADVVIQDYALSMVLAGLNAYRYGIEPDKLLVPISNETDLAKLNQASELLGQKTYHYTE